MDFKSEVAGRYLRIIAFVALLLGLSDAARALGISSGNVSPLSTYGTVGFAYLVVFCLARLFAAVGLWIRASWGAVLLIGATLIEIALHLTGQADVEMSAFGLGVRVLLVVSVLILLGISLRHRRAQD